MRDFFSISISTIFLLTGVLFAGKPVTFQHYFLSATGQKSFKKLVSAKKFIGGGLGRGPGRLRNHSEEEVALAALLNEKWGELALKDLLKRATPAGRLYAFFGLHLKYPKTFKSEVVEYRSSKQLKKKVTFQSGCEVIEMKCEEVVKGIENGHYDRLFQPEKEEGSLRRSSDATRSEVKASEDIPREVMDYAAALDKLIHSQDTTASVEAVYEKGTLAGAKIMDVIEELGDSTYNEVVEIMTGFEVNRFEILYVQPNAGYWFELSKKKGKKVDAQFFEICKQTFSHGIWEAYIEQQTDYSGCVKFGSNDLVKLYGKWRRYKSEFPDAYVSPSNEYLGDIEHELTEGNCACYGRDEVLREFTAFIKAFPDAKITPKIRERIKKIENKKSEIRFNCISEAEPQ